RPAWSAAGRSRPGAPPARARRRWSDRRRAGSRRPRRRPARKPAPAGRGSPRRSARHRPRRRGSASPWAGFNRLALRPAGYDGAMAETEPSFEELLETLKVAAAALRDAEVPFVLGGGLALWARGAPESERDL